eukprot:CAMPEP_0173384780 /NCGR_PEP_ID=MMETSP1356-20130122/7379_1 /TAXON_ID=77927 ORGANISM="Hemiselmis virescens, Strain PCC157" /NCGR_SAMPLE_ID=MMETSP1356 /ASSEMBLY_ACC=CAM_ASM_000847 /LENGTH=106 /DNA_ID=CAMNT_0014340319 /DNA_START=281 /DNA_END=601 /DNA_ORIENTATION=-
MPGPHAGEEVSATSTPPCGRKSLFLHVSASTLLERSRTLMQTTGCYSNLQSSASSVRGAHPSAARIMEESALHGTERASQTNHKFCAENLLVFPLVQTVLNFVPDD